MKLAQAQLLAENGPLEAKTFRILGRKANGHVGSSQLRSWHIVDAKVLGQMAANLPHREHSQCGPHHGARHD
jgi:hypothetical protein